MSNFDFTSLLAGHFCTQIKSIKNEKRKKSQINLTNVFLNAGTSALRIAAILQDKQRTTSSI